MCMYMYLVYNFYNPVYLVLELPNPVALLISPPPPPLEGPAPLSSLGQSLLSSQSTLGPLLSLSPGPVLLSLLSLFRK
jgi:hypothetical protein